MWEWRTSLPSCARWICLETTFPFAMTQRNAKWWAEMRKLGQAKSIFHVWLTGRLFSMQLATIDTRLTDLSLFSQKPSTLIRSINRNMVLRYLKKVSISGWNTNFSLLNTSPSQKKEQKWGWLQKWIWSWISYLNLLLTWVRGNLLLIISKI